MGNSLGTYLTGEKPIRHPQFKSFAKSCVIRKIELQLLERFASSQPILDTTASSAAFLFFNLWKKVLSVASLETCETALENPPVELFGIRHYFSGIVA